MNFSKKERLSFLKKRKEWMRLLPFNLIKDFRFESDFNNAIMLNILKKKFKIQIVSRD